MKDISQAPGQEPRRSVTVEALTRLACKELTTAQLIDLIGHLEQELIARSVPPDDRLLAERPRLERSDP